MQCRETPGAAGTQEWAVRAPRGHQEDMNEAETTSASVDLIYFQAKALVRKMINNELFMTFPITIVHKIQRCEH